MRSFDQYFNSTFKSFLNEGLIKTYPVDHLKRALDKTNFISDFETRISTTENGQRDDSRVITLIFSSRSMFDNYEFINDIESDIEKLKNIVNAFGFFIGHITKFTNTRLPTKNNNRAFHYRISIEPKYPSNAKTDIDDFYHVTYQHYVPKISKLGLTPRTSKTSFTHPGNRIYLLKTNNVERIVDLMMVLSDNKISNIPDEILKKGISAIDTYTSLNHYSKMVVYKVDVSGLKLYEDPMVTPKSDLSAFFTTQNISPDRLTIMS